MSFKELLQSHDSDCLLNKQEEQWGNNSRMACTLAHMLLQPIQPPNRQFLRQSRNTTNDKQTASIQEQYSSDMVDNITKYVKAELITHDLNPTELAQIVTILQQNNSANIEETQQIGRSKEWGGQVETKTIHAHSPPILLPTSPSHLQNETKLLTAVKSVKNLPFMSSKQFNDRSVCEEQIQMMSSKDDQNKSGSLQLSFIALQRITALHITHSNCPATPTQLCKHLHKYLEVVSRVQQIKEYHRTTMKLPVEIIGEAQYWHLQQREMRQTISEAPKMRRDEDRSRLLPTISNTTTNYYKPKQKQLR